MADIRLLMLALTSIGTSAPKAVELDDVETYTFEVDDTPVPTMHCEPLDRPYGKNHRRKMRGGKHD